jgi:hypothetical protein
MLLAQKSVIPKLKMLISPSTLRYQVLWEQVAATPYEEASMYRAKAFVLTQL